MTRNGWIQTRSLPPVLKTDGRLFYGTLKKGGERMDAVLFDLDGTLWNACEVLTLCWNRTLREKFPDLGRTLTRREVEGAMGKTLEEIARMYFPDAPLSRACEAVAVASQDELPTLRARGGQLYDGVRESLAALGGRYFLGIVSNCQGGYVEAFLQAHGLAPCFSDFLCEGMTGRGKGENIRALMAKNGLTRAVYIGDTAGDETAARAAQVPFIHAAYGFGSAGAPDAVVHSPWEWEAAAVHFL